MKIKNFIRNWIVLLPDPRKFFSFIRLFHFFIDWYVYKKKSNESVPMSDLYPCLMDKLTVTPFDPHYFYQAAWLSRKIAKSFPECHVDIGSSVGMLSVLSGFVDTYFLDFRPLKIDIDGLKNIGGSITALPFADKSILSISSLHVIEHIGLGRYGDPVDPNGSKKAVIELGRVVAPKGKLYISTPVGRERVCYNAHRVHSPDTILSWLPNLQLVSFSLVNDKGEFVNQARFSDANELDYGCGFFEFIRV